jgi:predicted phage terminase large subunit-like protein
LNESQRYELELLETLQKRRSIRRSLTEWCRFCGYEPARHHKLLIDKLEKVSAGEITRLAVFMPPGSAKSTYSSILFPPWYVAQHPQHQIITASNTAELAARWGRKVRNYLNEHQLTLGCGLASDSQAADRWQTSAGGEYIAVGVGGTVTGWRGDLVVIDDPIKGREQADSEEIRAKQWEWYTDDIYSRLKPGGRIVLIQTRWHEDDLAGRILTAATEGRDKWEVLSLPALAEEDDPLGRKPGEALWPDWENLEHLELKRLISGPRTWSALYQQRPAPEEGDYFKAEWLRPYVHQPALETLAVYGASDYAVTANGGDYTVHVVVGVDPEGNMYLLDMWRKQASSDVWIEAFCSLVKQYHPREWAEEQGQIKAGVGPFIDRMQRDRQAFVYRRAFPVRADKAVRAQSIRGRMAQGGLYVPQRAEWFADLRSELLSFPAGKHDDIVDALGLIGQLLNEIGKGEPIKAAEKPKNPSGYVRHDEGERLDDWKAY